MPARRRRGARGEVAVGAGGDALAGPRAVSEGRFWGAGENPTLKIIPPPVWPPTPFRGPPITPSSRRATRCHGGGVATPIPRFGGGGGDPPGQVGAIFWGALTPPCTPLHPSACLRKAVEVASLLAGRRCCVLLQGRTGRRGEMDRGGGTPKKKPKTTTPLIFHHSRTFRPRPQLPAGLLGAAPGRPPRPDPPRFPEPGAARVGRRRPPLSPPPRAAARQPPGGGGRPQKKPLNPSEIPQIPRRWGVTAQDPPPGAGVPVVPGLHVAVGAPVPGGFRLHRGVPAGPTRRRLPALLRHLPLHLPAPTGPRRPGERGQGLGDPPKTPP